MIPQLGLHYMPIDAMRLQDGAAVRFAEPVTPSVALYEPLSVVTVTPQGCGGQWFDGAYEHQVYWRCSPAPGGRFVTTNAVETVTFHPEMGY